MPGWAGPVAKSARIWCTTILAGGRLGSAKPLPVEIAATNADVSFCDDVSAIFLESETTGHMEMLQVRKEVSRLESGCYIQASLTHRQAGSVYPITSHKSQVTSHKSQVTSHKSQVTSHKSHNNAA